MKTIYCDSGYLYCKVENIPTNYKNACKVLNDLKWEKIGYKTRWGWYCPIHAKAMKPLKNLKKWKEI